MRVKICGIRTLEDATLAVACGADGIGLLVGQAHASADFIAPELAREIAASCPPYVSSVLVTHLEDPEDIHEIACFTGISTIQIHSTPSVSKVRALRRLLPSAKLIQNFHVTPELNQGEMSRFEELVDAFLLDSINVSTDQVGGTGMVHDWAHSARIVQSARCLVLLAGGLNPSNVVEAIGLVRPYGVDVNSGVKNSAGFKDQVKLCQFVYQAKKSHLQRLMAVQG